MKKKRQPKSPDVPTQAEFDVLSVLWRLECATVRQVYEAMGPARGVRYTTVLKIMQLMAAKGLVTRDTSQRSHVYRAATEQQITQRGLIADLVERAFGGSLQQLLLRAVEDQDASPEALAEIRALLDKHEET